MTQRDRIYYTSGASASVAGDLPAADAVRVGDLLFISGQVALAPDGTLVSPGDVAGQARHVFSSIAALAEQAGGSLADVIEVVTFHSDPRDIDEVLHVAREFFDEADGFPAWTPVGFVGSPVKGAQIMARAVAHLGSEPKRSYQPGGKGMSPGLPVAGACERGGIVIVAGQTAADDQGQVTRPLDHKAQARTAYDHMFAVLGEAGGSVGDILDFTSFHHDIRGAAPTLEQIYIPDVMGPLDTDLAASTSHLGSTGLYREDILGTYSAIADLTPGKRVGSTPDSIWWKGVYPIAGAARKEGGRLVTIAGQVCSAPDGSILYEGDVEGQARYIFGTIRETLAGFGLGMEDVVDVRSFHKDARWGSRVAAVGREFFSPSAPPAWTYAGMQGLWFEGYLHEIAAIAIAP